LHGSRPHLLTHRRFFDRQTTEEPQLDDLALALIYCSQTIKRVIELNQLDRSLVGDYRNIIEWHVLGSTTALDVTIAASVIDQDMAHYLRGHRKKVGTIPPVNLLLIDES